jgi:hypothetical protein
MGSIHAQSGRHRKTRRRRAAPRRRRKLRRSGIGTIPLLRLRIGTDHDFPEDFGFI